MKKEIITFNQLLETFQADHGQNQDNIFFDIVCALSKKITSKEVFVSFRNQPIDFKIKQFNKMIHNYFVKQMPLSHVTGSTKFMGLKFQVSKKVLSPRDVTEQMVSDFIAAHKQEAFHEVLDMCCGCGVIGISIKKYIPQFNVICVDKYWAPIFDTNHNAIHNQTALTIDVKDAFEYLENKPYLDILISNPPYVNPHNFDNKKMFKFESKKALIAKEDGLYFYRRYFKYLQNHPFKEAWFEIGYDQKEIIPNLLKEFDKLSYSIPEGKQYIIIKPVK